MEDERFRALLEKVINFNREEPPPSALRAEFEERRSQSQDLSRASTDEAEKAQLWLKWEAPAPAAVRAEYDEFMKPRREFQRALRRDFPEWHFHSYKHPVVGGGTVTMHGEFAANPKRLQEDLRRVWALASTKKTDEAKSSLLRLKMQFSRGLKKVEQQDPHLNGWEHDKRAWGLMVESLEWLQNRLGRLKVCENPKCATGRKYFFRDYSNDKYCCSKCVLKAKVLRQAERDAESQKARKEPTKPALTREKMSISQTKRWNRYRAKTGKLKYDRP